jgi:hemerythrin
MAFEWSDDLSVGVERIDAQHRELIARTNALLRALPGGGGPASQAAMETLLYLSAYVEEHFADEERYMAEVAFPGLPAHRVEHLGFRETLRVLVRRFSLGGIDEVLRRGIEEEVCGWIVRHVLGTDRAIGQFVRGRVSPPGRSGPPAG